MARDKLEEVLILLKHIDNEMCSRVSQHEEEHAFIRELTEEYRIRKELRQALKAKVLTGTIWTALVAITISIAYSIKHWITGSFIL